MAEHAFFNESTEQSAIKASIVSKYFTAWAKVMVGVAKRSRRAENRIAYIDLFAGPGRYQDGGQSTPLLILRRAIDDTNLSKMLVTLFNDKDETNCRTLENAIKSLDGLERLKYQPQVMNEEVGENMVTRFEEMRLVPTVFFVDPWGYKGLSKRLVNAVVKDWGCECIFFFNYNRASMGLANDAVANSMNALFGEEAAEDLRQRIEGLPPTERETAIVDVLCRSLAMEGETRFVVPFRFRNDRDTRTSHYIIHTSKHFRGYEIMKSVMASASSRQDAGVASFEFCPADERFPMLFEFEQKFNDLKAGLLEHFAGRTLPMKTVYEQYEQADPPTPFIKKNYKEALIVLEQEGSIHADPPANSRPKQKGEITFGDTVEVRFPAK